MQQVQPLIEPGPQRRRCDPDCGPPHDQEIWRQLRVSGNLDVGVNAVIPIRITATINPPLSSPRAAPRKRSNPLRPASFINQRAMRPAAAEEQNHRKEDDEKTEYLSQPQVL